MIEENADGNDNVQDDPIEVVDESEDEQEDQSNDYA